MTARRKKRRKRRKRTLLNETDTGEEEESEEEVTPQSKCEAGEEGSQRRPSEQLIAFRTAFPESVAEQPLW